MRISRGWSVAVFPAMLVACSPSLDWRDVRPQDSGVTMLFPCRPDPHERSVRMAAVDLRMQMVSCNAAGATFSLVYVDAPQAAQGAPLLAELRARAAANVGGTAVARTFLVPGATPNEQSAALRIEGRLPDGRRVIEHAAFFARGLRLYQVTAIGETVSPDAVETFFGAVKVVPA
ncbi:MAG: hypothetical protein ABI460_15730 [Caldimonas sp.]